MEPMAPQRDTVRPKIHESLRAAAELVLRVPGEARGEPGEPILHFDDMRGGNWSLRLLGGFSATGFVIEIYRVP